VAAVTQQEGVIVTAVRGGDGTLQMTSWGVAADGRFTALASAGSGSVSDVAVIGTGAFEGVVTASRTSAGNLALTAWKTSLDGRSITAGGHAEAGAVSAFAVAGRGPDGRLPVTAVRDSDGLFRLISWRLSNGGDTIARLGTASAGAISEVALAGVGDPNLTGVVACRDADGMLRLMTWELASDGSTLTRWGGALAGEASRISVAGTTDSGRTFFVTACAESHGRLKLINWESNF
jgi:hypothetical protein